MRNRLSRMAGFGLVLVFLLGLVAACAAPAEEAEFSLVEITDQLGRTVKLEGIPERIISLAPSNTEILFALGLGDRVVAVTDYCDYPPEAKTKPSIGSYSTPNIEEIVALSPDLILATSIHEGEIIPKLEKAGLTVLALDSLTIDEVLAAITMVGKVTGKGEEASRLTAEMRDRIKAVTDKTRNLAESERPRVFYSVWHDPLMSAGAGTFQADLIQKAGGANIAGELTGWETISLEIVITANPEVMIVGAMTDADADANFLFITNEPRLENTDARRNSLVYAVDANVTSRPGPRIVDALEWFAVLIHPELFQEK
ncbi:MAG: ABC transporter substrate-binding protein [Dehalococcoidales bacterium]